jgi:hypothetical protein
MPAVLTIIKDGIEAKCHIRGKVVSLFVMFADSILVVLNHSYIAQIKGHDSFKYTCRLAA